MTEHDFNKVIISGRADRTPELNFTQDNTPVINFRIIVSAKKHDEHFNVTAWGELAKYCANELTADEKVLVEGAMHNRVDPSGENNSRSSFEITAKRIFSIGEKISREPNGKELSREEV